MRLLELLKSKQTEEDLTGREFAAKLGVAESTWKHIRSGRRRMNETVARAAMRVYPDLTAEAVSFLLSGDTTAA